MSKKKKGGDADESEATATVNEQTASLTASEIMFNELGMLGRKDLQRPNLLSTLVRVSTGRSSDELLKYLEVPRASGASDEDRLIILGPYAIAHVKEWVEKKWLRPQDQLMISFDRWKTVATHFPQLTRSFTDEHTSTATLENTASFGSDPGVLDVEALDDTQNPEAQPDKVVQPTMNLVNPAATVPVRPATASPAPPRGPNVSSSPSKSASSGARGVTPQRGLQFMIVALAVGGIGFYMFKKNVARQSHEYLKPTAKPLERKVLNWPEQLRPQDIQALLMDESSALRRLKPILYAYERGGIYLNAQDEQTLRALADPASASWEARKLATNQLAVFQLAKLRVEEARGTLQPLVDASPNEFMSQLNMSLIRLAEGDFTAAFESASTGARLSPPGQMWMAYAVLGYVQSSASRAEEAEKSFNTALARSPGNPLLLGLQLQNAIRHEAPRRKIQSLLADILWADPDKNLDSPFKAPLAGHILIAESFAGLKKATELVGQQLSAGQAAFFRYLEARSRSNPLGENLKSLSTALSSETDPTSQLLYAYLLAEEAKLDAASEILTRVIGLAEDKKISSSYPWTFAADLHLARGQMDQAVIFYQTALRRNPQDVSAVLGLALALREAGDYIGAEQKLQEALSLDPNFIPALLRISRLEWHRRIRSE